MKKNIFKDTLFFVVFTLSKNRVLPFIILLFIAVILILLKQGG
jgi:hypothetical protein